MFRSLHEFHACADSARPNPGATYFYPSCISRANEKSIVKVRNRNIGLELETLSLCLLSFRLEEFEFSEGCRRLGLDVANLIIQRCPNLRRISRLRSWGRVSRKQVMNTISLFSPIPYLPELSKPSIFLQLDAVKTEVLLRNFDLVIDNGWNSIG